MTTYVLAFYEIDQAYGGPEEGGLQRHRPDVGSVIYTGGRYSVAVYEDFAPKFYPEVRPRYE
jgi:hypothetical protein